MQMAFAWAKGAFCSMFAQVFESVEDVEQTEADAQLEDGKQAKILNGMIANGTCSPESGHPSSQNFYSTSEHSFSTDDNATESSKTGACHQVKSGGAEAPKPQSSTNTLSEDKLVGEDLDSLEGECPINGSLEVFIPVGGSTAGVLPDNEVVGLSVVDESWADSEAEKRSLVGSEDNLSEEPEMESLYPQLDSLAVADLANNEVSSVSSTGVTYSVSICLGISISSWDPVICRSLCKYISPVALCNSPCSFCNCMHDG